jgi:VWFA-related protein
MIRALFAILVATAALQPPPAAPPQTPQTFRSGAQIVEVDVRVLGKNGKFVTDLGLADFEISEDGVPQKIQSVVLVTRDPAPSAPLAPSAPAPLAPPAPSAPLAPPARSAGQTWVFVFDTTHLTTGPLGRARTAVARFIQEKFREGDLGGVVADGKLLNNRFTGDRAELLKATQSVNVPNDTRARMLLQGEWPRLQDEEEATRIALRDPESLKTALDRACTEHPDECEGLRGPGGKKSPANIEPLIVAKAREAASDVRTRTQQTLSVIDTLSRGLARLPGPKTVVFFSEGLILQDQHAELRQAVGQAARAGAHFYSIDARGLDRAGGSAIIDKEVPFDSHGPSVKFDSQADGMNSLAVDTGGFAIRNENNFTRALDDIERDAGTYYVVGYTPAKETFDGKYREISVKVSRTGVKVRARRGYLAIEPARLSAPRPTAVTTKAAELPVVPISLGLVSLPDTFSITPPAPPVAARIDTGKIVAALGRESSSSASARLRPSASAAPDASRGFGETSSALNTPDELGWSAYEKGDVETAVRHLTEAAKASDARPWVVYALGLSHFALRRFPDAAQAWERVRQAVPEFEPIYFALADAYGLQREEGTALKVLREAERRWPADAEIADAIGVIQIRRGALDAAIESFERATAVAPADALGYFNLARAHQMRLLKSQRYDPLMQKWIGGDEDRRRAIAMFRKYLELGGPYERAAHEALASLAWK